MKVGDMVRKNMDYYLFIWGRDLRNMPISPDHFKTGVELLKERMETEPVGIVIAISKFKARNVEVSWLDGEPTFEYPQTFLEVLVQ